MFSAIEVVVMIVCVIGVGAFMLSLFRADRCSFGGLHKWRVTSDYRFIQVKECQKCKETKTVDKIKI